MPKKKRVNDGLAAVDELLPRKRQQRNKNLDQSDFRTFRSLWNLTEKQQLLAGLRRYDKDDLKNIGKLIPTRTHEQIKWFIEQISERKVVKEDMPLTTPIELWLHTAEDLTHHGDDHSCVLSKVMSIAGNLEPHAPCSGPKHPDYGAIYRYMAALFRGDQPPTLRQIDAAVVVDLLHNLASDLRGMDISDQCKMMRAKYELLHMKVDITDRDKAYEATRRAFEEDLLQEGITDMQTEILPWTKGKGRVIGQHKSGSSCGRDRRNKSANDNTAQPGPSNQNDNDNDEGDIESTPEDISGGKVVDSERVLNKDHKPSKYGRVEHRPKKTQLYSLNPFCIPVKYLKPKQKGVQ